MTITVHHGDMREVLAQMISEGVQVDSCVCDPPYHLTSIVKRFGGENAAPAKSKQTGAFTRASRGFMGKQWDGGDIAFDLETWRLVFELLPPGGRLLAFSGDRTYHRMATAIEAAGFVIPRMFLNIVSSCEAVQSFVRSLSDEQLRAFARCIDESEFGSMLAWIYGSGFPKSHDFGASFDKALLGIDRDEDPKDWEASRSHFATMWEGWGSDVKPAFEPICMAMKPLEGTIAGNVAKHGVGGVNVDGCRIGDESTLRSTRQRMTSQGASGVGYANQDHRYPEAAQRYNGSETGRFPANVLHDGSDVVLAGFPSSDGALRAVGPEHKPKVGTTVYGDYGPRPRVEPRGDSGSAGRFFYSSKADADDRLGSKHPTVKRVDLIRWLVRLVTPPGGTVLDPFAGSGTTGMACLAEGFDAILVEREAEYVADIKRRIAHVSGEDTPLFAGLGP